MALGAAPGIPQSPCGLDGEDTTTEGFASARVCDHGFAVLPASVTRRMTFAAGSVFLRLGVDNGHTLESS